ncbi:MAG TPA: hypothetical protein GX718_09975 [Brevibacterium sp.]|nr:hypothetical protein [Brevibacterium sp.]
MKPSEVPDWSDMVTPAARRRISREYGTQREMVKLELVQLASTFGGCGDLATLTGLARMSALIDEVLVEVVADWRADRYTWAEIGEALRVTKQAAHKRYGDKKLSDHLAVNPGRPNVSDTSSDTRSSPPAS